MTTFAWPDFGCNRFEMRIVPNVRVFPNPFNGSAQVLDMGGEHWEATIGLVPGKTALAGAAREAFFDRLQGPLHRIALWNLRRPVPLGTIRDGVGVSVVNGSLAAVSLVNGSAAAVTLIAGGPSIAYDVAAGASSTVIQTLAGRTIVAGDHFAFVSGQTVRVMLGGVANGSGLLPVEFLPRARTAIAAHTPIAWNRPTVNFMLKGDGVPTTHRPGFFDGTSFDLVEAY